MKKFLLGFLSFGLVITCSGQMMNNPFPVEGRVLRDSSGTAVLNWETKTLPINWDNTANPWADNEVSDTLTIGASGSVNDSALSANVAHLNAAEIISANWVNTANPWADNEVSDTLTVGASGSVNDSALSANVALLNQNETVSGDWSFTGTYNFSNAVGLILTTNPVVAGQALTSDGAGQWYLSAYLTQAGGDGLYLEEANNLSDLDNAATARTNLSLVVGTQVQAWDTDLDTWATVSPSANGQSLVSAANYAAMRTLLDLEAGTDFYSIAGADAAFEPLDANITKDNEVETLTANWVNTAHPWADNEVSDTLTVGASGSVNDSALSAQVAHLNVAETISADWVNTANPWADNEVSDTITVGASGSVNDDALSANVAVVTNSASEGMIIRKAAGGDFYYEEHERIGLWFQSVSTNVTTTGYTEHTALKAEDWFEQTGRHWIKVRILYTHSTTGAEVGVAITRNGTQERASYDVSSGTTQWDSITFEHPINIAATTDDITLSFKTSSGTLTIQEISLFLIQYPVNYTLEQWIN